MTDSARKPGSADMQPDGGAVRSGGRRRLLQAGISAAPVIMTIASRPVLAQAGQFCQAPSGFYSGNVSQPNGAICGGLTPGYWKNYDPGQAGPPALHTWPSGFYPVANYNSAGNSGPTLFCDKFPSCDVYSGWSLLQVLQTDGPPPQGPPHDVGRHIVAALLNFAAGIVPSTILDLATIQAIWGDYITMNTYSPASGVQWDHAQIVAYLKTTMPL